MLSILCWLSTLCERLLSFCETNASGTVSKSNKYFLFFHTDSINKPEACVQDGPYAGVRDGGD